MTDAPLVSVIIAAFNAEDDIGAAIGSALAQVGVQIEVVVGDDASTDSTASRVRDVDDPRVRLVRLAKNGGPSAARNAAMAQARGDWFAVLDADDVMAPDRIAGLLSAAQGADADIIADNMQVRSSAGDRLFIDEDLDGGLESLGLARYALNNRLFAPGRCDGYLKPMFRAQFLRDHGLAYDERLRISEDFLLVAQMLACGAAYVRRRSAGYIYSVHASSISHRLSVADAQAMVAADKRFLAVYGDKIDAPARAAMQAHLKSLTDGAAFVRLIEALKARRWSSAVAEGLRTPAALRHLSMPIMARLRPRA